MRSPFACVRLRSSFLQAHGRQEWSPSPSETAKLIRSYYSAPRTMLMRFTDDGLDETSQLTSMLQQDGAMSTDLTLRTLPGNHLRPMVQNFVDIPTPMAHFASNTIRSSGTMLGVQNFPVNADILYDVFLSKLETWCRLPVKRCKGCGLC